MVIMARLQTGIRTPAMAVCITGLHPVTSLFPARRIYSPGPAIGD